MYLEVADNRVIVGHCFCISYASLEISAKVPDIVRESIESILTDDATSCEKKKARTELLDVCSSGK